MDGFSRFKTAAEELPNAVSVMDRRGRGDLGHLPANRGGLPRARQEGGEAQMMQAVIDAISSGIPNALVEIRSLGRTLK